MSIVNKMYRVTDNKRLIGNRPSGKRFGNPHDVAGLVVQVICPSDTYSSTYIVSEINSGVVYELHDELFITQPVGHIQKKKKIKFIEVTDTDQGA